MILKEVLCSTGLHLFDQKYIKNRDIVKYNYFIINSRINSSSLKVIL